jgi:hypothetical protein
MIRDTCVSGVDLNTVVDFLLFGRESRREGIRFRNYYTKLCILIVPTVHISNYMIVNRSYEGYNLTMRTHIYICVCVMWYMKSTKRRTTKACHKSHVHMATIIPSGCRPYWDGCIVCMNHDVSRHARVL